MLEATRSKKSSIIYNGIIKPALNRNVCLALARSERKCRSPYSQAKIDRHNYFPLSQGKPFWIGEDHPPAAAGRALVIEPHADDAVLNLGAYLCFLGENCKVSIFNLISDYLGVLPPLLRRTHPADYKKSEIMRMYEEISPEEAMETREREGRQAAELLGAEFRAFRMMFPFKEMQLEYDEKGKLLSYKSSFGQPQDSDLAKLSEAIFELGPDTIFLPFPVDTHPMHRSVSRLSLRVLREYQSANPDIKLYFYGGFGALLNNVQAFLDSIDSVFYYGRSRQQKKNSVLDAYHSQNQRQITYEHPDYTTLVTACGRPAYILASRQFGREIDASDLNHAELFSSFKLAGEKYRPGRSVFSQRREKFKIAVRSSQPEQMELINEANNWAKTAGENKMKLFLFEDNLFLNAGEYFEALPVKAHPAMAQSLKSASVSHFTILLSGREGYDFDSINSAVSALQSGEPEQLTRWLMARTDQNRLVGSFFDQERYGRDLAGFAEMPEMINSDFQKRPLVISAHQPQFLPWLGYFNKIAESDIFVSQADVKYYTKGFQNRVKVSGKKNHWLTVPVKRRSEEKYIEEVEIYNDPDKRKHWAPDQLRTIERLFVDTPYFCDYFFSLKRILSAGWVRLEPLNEALTRFVMAKLGLRTPIIRSSDYRISSHLRKTEKLAALFLEVRSQLAGEFGYMPQIEYLSGIGALEYLIEAAPEGGDWSGKLIDRGIPIRYQTYNHPIHNQDQHDDFVPTLSAIDALFNLGRQARELI